jgi:hypothetical protein
MADYGPSSTGGFASSIAQRPATLSYIAGGLGVLSFIWGFLTWYTEGSGPDRTSYGGYAFIVNSAAIIGFSLAGGLLALAATVERRGPSLTPTVLATVSFLLVVGALIGKGNVDTAGGNSPNAGIGIGLLLELITVILQVAVLAFAWMAATGRVRSNRPPAWQQGQQGQQGYGAQQPYGAQQTYGPPQTYGAQQPYGSQQTYGAPQPHGAQQTYGAPQPHAAPSSDQTQQLPGYPQPAAHQPQHPAQQPQSPAPAPQHQQGPTPTPQQPQPQSPPPGYGAPPTGPGYQPPDGQ